MIRQFLSVINIGKYKNYFPAFFIIITGVILRIIRIKNLTIWSDEYHTIRVISHPVKEIILGQYSDFNPPFYYFLLNLYTRITGVDEVLMRIFSLIFGTLSLVLIYRITIQLFPQNSKTTATFCLILFSFHPIFINYSTEIRAYSLLQFLFLTGLFSYLQIRTCLQPKLFWLFVLMLSIVLGFYTHHFGFFIFLTVLIFAIIDQHGKKNSKTIRKHLYFLFILSILLYLPGFYYIFLNQVMSYPKNILDLIPPHVFLNIFKFSIPSSRLDTVITSLCVLSFISGGFYLKNNYNDEEIKSWFIYTIIISLGIILLAYSSNINMIPRYFIHISTIILLVIVSIFNAKKNYWLSKLRLFLTVITVAFVVIYGVEFCSNTQYETQLADWKTNWKLVSDKIKSIKLENEPVAIIAWDSTPVEYYLGEKVFNPNDFSKDNGNMLVTSYLLIVSENSPTINGINRYEILYEDMIESFALIRVYPD